MKLRRFWLEFEDQPDSRFPAGVLLGCGVTAADPDEALELVRERVFDSGQLPPLKRLVEDVDISTLNQDHVIPNMGAPVVRGIWFPRGYEG